MRTTIRLLNTAFCLSLVGLSASAQESDDASSSDAMSIRTEFSNLASLSQDGKPRFPMSCKADGQLLETSPKVSVPPPSASELRAFSFLEQEAALYKSDASDFKQKLSTIVRHHYEDRRRRMLAAIDKEIAYEKKGLHEARDEAIARLVAFIERYSGADADPQATPDAMFRLAALYEEKARENYDGDLTEGLRPAIALYRSVATEYPGYDEMGAVLYYLGHAYVDAARVNEAQQAWRSLVCENRYSVVAAPGSDDGISVQPQVQDHDDKFWNEWYNKNPLPLDQLGKRPDLTQVGVSEEEVAFKDPYSECTAVVQPEEAGQEPRYVAEVWWQLGNFHFDQLDPKAGPYNLNRAVSAYDQSLQYKRPPLYGVAMYKQAWTYFKQQRYQNAIDWFVQLLHYADKQEAETGDPGADFRAEAYTYVAGSLTYLDLAGPRPEDPFIPRNDVLDLETDPLVAEEKMALAIERVQDPALIPQDKLWTVEIYKALAREFIEISQNRNAISTMEILARKFPLDRDVPLIVNRTAELYDQLAQLAPRGSETKAEYSKKALEARTSLVKYVGTTAWTNANRDDPEALTQAEELVRVGLRRAAADHTNYARAYKDRALQLSDPEEQREQLSMAVQEYRLAAEGWGAFIDQDPNAVDAYESKFWRADANFWVAVLQVPLGKMPTAAEIEAARTTSVLVRDSNEDDKYKQPAAYYVVTLAEKVLEGEALAFEESGGQQGIERKESVTFVGEGDSRKVKKEDVPAPVQAAVCARDEYNARISMDEDPQKNGLMYASQSADYFFVYGQFEEARRRYLPIYAKYCGVNKWGYSAWEKLISMSNFSGNAEESRALVESRSCAVDEETRLAEDGIRTPVRQGVAYLEARKLFEQASGMQDGPERAAIWRKAAAAYKVALASAPDRDEAPEAAMNGAYAYKQVGEYDKAIAMYSLFISKYGDEKTIAGLQKTDPESYAQRVGFLQGAYEALASAYVLFFDYPKAAETSDKISSIEHFDREKRQVAAKNALNLYVNLDDASGMTRARGRYESLGASQEELAEADFLIASAALKKWDPNSPDSGANQVARTRAQNAMSLYYEQNKSRPVAAKYAVHAAYQAALARRASKSPAEDTWWENTTQAFERYLASAPRKDGKSTAVGSQEATLAAEAAYTLLDKKLKKDFDYDSGHHRYAGTAVEVVADYTKDAKEAKIWFDRLQVVIDKYVSQKWATVAIARQASVYDSLRTGLYNTRPPELKMFTAAQEKALKVAEESDNDDLIDKADQIRTAVNDAWRQKRDQELDSADRVVVDRYAVSVMLAQRYNLSHPAVTRAIRRLAFMTDVVGEAKMSDYTANNKELAYSAGKFQRMRPGVTEPPETVGLPTPGLQEVNP